jgi:hypothetical protein
VSIYFRFLSTFLAYLIRLIVKKIKQYLTRELCRSVAGSLRAPFDGIQPSEAEANVNTVVFKNSVRTSKRTPHFTITNINWLTLFKFNLASVATHFMEKYSIYLFIIFTFFRTCLSLKFYGAHRCSK